MRLINYLTAAIVLALAGWATPVGANSSSTPPAATLVIGQPDFTHGAHGTNANGLFDPSGAAVDAAGNLYVADAFNNRVLEYNAPLSNGMAANLVIGQPDFTHTDVNHGGLSASSFQILRITPMGSAPAA
jgi:hypothetical protein